ncbi:MAG: hypothetical protein H6741_12745 [Alphaproteobacteria bacterium]|nr:hypothetical protein [Alphaproteobacteria bacterium]
MNLSKLSVRPSVSSNQRRQASAARGLEVRAEVKAGSGRASYDSSYVTFGVLEYRG